MISTRIYQNNIIIPNNGNTEKGENITNYLSKPFTNLIYLLQTWLKRPYPTSRLHFVNKGTFSIWNRKTSNLSQQKITDFQFGQHNALQTKIPPNQQHKAQNHPRIRLHLRNQNIIGSLPNAGRINTWFTERPNGSSKRIIVINPDYQLDFQPGIPQHGVSSNRPPLRQSGPIRAPKAIKIENRKSIIDIWRNHR